MAVGRFRNDMQLAGPGSVGAAAARGVDHRRAAESRTPTLSSRGRCGCETPLAVSFTVRLSHDSHCLYGLCGLSTCVGCGRRVPIAVLESLLTIGEVVLQVLSEELSAHSIGLPFRWGLPPLADTVG